MRIVVANKFWYRRAGAERVMLDEVAWLEAAGHTVAHFSTTHPDNEPSAWSDYFVPYLEIGPDGGLSLAGKAVAAGRMFHSPEARRRFDRLLADFRPDVVHIHGIHRQISPSILAAARDRGVPVVQTLHDLNHICPEDLLLRGGVEPCEPRLCGELWYGACVTHRCVRHSAGASALAAAEVTWQRLRRVYERGIARFISPSRFHAQQMARGGWTVPTTILPNAVPLAAGHRPPGSGFAVIGRLAREKGIEVAVRAACAEGLPLTVAGEGPLGERLRAEYPQVTFTGRLDGPGVAALVARSRGVLVPSLTFENAPMAVLEPMSAGVPVVASAIGGIPEQVTDGIDGLLVPPGDEGALASAMRRLAEDDELVGRLGAASRETIARRFCPERHLEGLVAVYREVGAGR